MDRSRSQAISQIILGIAGIATILVYLPGLAGSFAFDDSGVLTQNLEIRVTTLDPRQWLAAVASYGGDGIQSRWLGMLTFAMNHYLTGMDPFWFKATNLAIHMLSGLLLFMALRALADFHAIACKPIYPNSRFSEVHAATIAALWLVLPINLTGVLYIAQRLETLSHTFVFLGLWWYLRSRIAFALGRTDTRGMWISIFVCTLLGLQVKEPAVLLPLYTFCIEFACGGFRKNDKTWNTPVATGYLLILGIPLLAGFAWLSGGLQSSNDPARGIGPGYRTLTEARVMFDYMNWTLVPNLDALTLYHDDIVVSEGLLKPPATFAAIVGISLLLGVAIWQRTKRPLFTLGIFWFFGGHLLTGTVIQLLLVFEHRNYFPSIGLLLALISLSTTIGFGRHVRVFAVAAAFVFAFYAFTTSLRALEWSSPISLAASDATKRPDSSAAQYEYARLLLASTQNGKPRDVKEKAFAVLERMARDPKADAAHNQLLIVYANALKLPINPEWWEGMIAKLMSRPVSSTDATALVALLKCYDKAFCSRDLKHLHEAFEAATSHRHCYAMVNAAYGRFAASFLKDFALAERQFRQAMERAPNDTEFRAQFADYLIDQRKFEMAKQIIGELHNLNRYGLLDKQISEIEAKLARAVTSEPPT